MHSLRQQYIAATSPTAGVDEDIQSQYSIYDSIMDRPLFHLGADEDDENDDDDDDDCDDDDDHNDDDHGDDDDDDGDDPFAETLNTPRFHSSAHLATEVTTSRRRRKLIPNDAPARHAFLHAFGDRSPNSYQAPTEECDDITSVAFNAASDMIAAGDSAGRIVLFARHHTTGHSDPFQSTCSSLLGTVDGEQTAPIAANNAALHLPKLLFPFPTKTSASTRNLQDKPPSTPCFHFWTQFQSHRLEFDFLKSIAIDEKINRIAWCRSTAGCHRLISTNDKTIKVWRIGQRNVKKICSLSCPTSPGATPSLSFEFASSLRSDMTSLQTSPRSLEMQIPRLQHVGTIITASPRRIFSNAHTHHINSISLNSDEETFLSADDLRVHLWNLQRGDGCFNVIDLKLTSMQYLSEVITAVQFHPFHCHLFAHATSRGIIRISDLRASALCERPARRFQHGRDPQCNSLPKFQHFLSSISDVQFAPNGRSLVRRDYMTLQLWDFRMDWHPLLVIPVHEHLRPHLPELYERESILDKFQCRFSHDNKWVHTGTYNALMQTFSTTTGMGYAGETSLEFWSGLDPEGLRDNDPYRGQVRLHSESFDLGDLSRRVLSFDTSQTEQLTALASRAALYLFHVPPGSGN